MLCTTNTDDQKSDQFHEMSEQKRKHRKDEGRVMVRRRGNTGNDGARSELGKNRETRILTCRRCHHDDMEVLAMSRGEIA